MTGSKKTGKTAAIAAAVLLAIAGALLIITGAYGLSGEKHPLERIFTDSDPEGSIYEGEPVYGSDVYMADAPSLIGFHRYYYFIYDSDLQRTAVVRAGEDFGENFTKAGLRNETGVKVSGKAKPIKGELKKYAAENWGEEYKVYIDTYHNRICWMRICAGAAALLLCGIAVLHGMGKRSLKKTSGKLDARVVTADSGLLLLFLMLTVISFSI